MASCSAIFRGPHSAYIWPTFGVHPAYIWRTSRLHVAYIWRTSRLHLAYIWRTSRLHLAYIWRTSRLHLAYDGLLFRHFYSLARSTPLLLEFVHPLLQGLHHASQDHRELLVVQGQQLAVAHGLAERLAQFPGRQDVLGDEADLILGALHTIVDLGFQFVE